MEKTTAKNEEISSSDAFKPPAVLIHVWKQKGYTGDMVQTDITASASGSGITAAAGDSPTLGGSDSALLTHEFILLHRLVSLKRMYINKWKWVKYDALGCRGNGSQPRASYL